MNTASGVFLTETRVRLLESIERCGSISGAARAMAMSYKWTWDEVNAMNRQAPGPLVVRNVGGRRGGGTSLTPYGVRVVAFYRALAREYQDAVEALSEHVLTDARAVNFRYLLRRRALAGTWHGREAA
ncbi:winged helix-turn-helix domain-containing protein [Parasulfuritortus cantonensis]|uniref:winged helix-turn-helix domain-containing protein n=1 Tax=Parasulfuritortus cantonensis TaxID=2528202 RepID=UPI00197CBFD7|nr:LysR family transcriptional regulator [Parasulfuritortus cantonensis]